MKILLTLFVLFFSSMGVADDISDFQIEGISIGDSALKFFNLNQIKNNEWDYYDNKEFVPVQIDKLSFFKAPNNSVIIQFAVSFPSLPFAACW